MAEALSGFIVVMESDVPPEKADEVIAALKMIKGVIDVKEVTREPLEQRVVKSRAKEELRKTLNQVLDKL